MGELLDRRLLVAEGARAFAGLPPASGMRVSADEVRARVQRLPPLPEAVHRLREALHDDDIPVERVVDAVGADQALTMTALKLANSSFYGVSRRVATLRDAVQILGLQTLSSAVLTAAVLSQFDRGSCPGFDFDACWRHAVANGLCAQMLAEPRGLDTDLAYTVGLMHDVGHLALAAHFPVQFAAAIEFGAEHDLSPLEAEQAVLGMDHGEVGGLIAERWRLAPVIVEAVRLHHVEPAGPHRDLMDVLHLADNVTHALDIAGAADERVPPMSLQAWERMAVTPAELQQVFERLEQRMASLP